MIILYNTPKISPLKGQSNTVHEHLNNLLSTVVYNAVI